MLLVSDWKSLLSSMVLYEELVERRDSKQEAEKALNAKGS